MIRVHTFSFDSLGITSGDLEEFIGYFPGSSMAAFTGSYEQALSEAAELCRIEAGYRCFEDVSVGNSDVLLDNKRLLTGKLINQQLTGASGAAVFVCTAGSKITDVSKQYAADNNELMAYLLDVTGSVCAEKAADLLEDKLLEELREEGYGLSNRCSPGYCGWDVAEQHKLFSMLPDNFCGVSLTASSLMHPIKSVSGIIGYGPNAGLSERPCHQCRQTQCIYKKAT